jgi:uncharacterized membrane protein YkoI
MKQLAFMIVLSMMVLGTGASRATANQAHRGGRAPLRPKVSARSAREIAVAQVPHGVITSQELEREKGRLIYSFDFKVSGQTGIDEVNVDAMTGKVLALEHETPKAERREKGQENRDAQPKSIH